MNTKALGWARAVLPPLAIFSALSVFWTWPLAGHLSTRLPLDLGDPLLNTWILWWNAQVLPLTDRWWNAPVFFPSSAALALSEHLLGISVLATPVLWASGSPVVAHNISVLLSYALSGFLMYLLVLRLTDCRIAAWAAGIAFAFAPYRAGQFSHLQVVTSQWMPAMLLGLHAYLETGRRRWLALFGAAWLIQALANGYYLLFLPPLVALWLAWFVDWRAPRRALPILAAWAAASLPLIPILLAYRAVHSALGLVRDIEDIRQFSATPASFLAVPPMLAIWPPVDGRTQEDLLFPGLTAVAVVGIATAVLVRRHQLRSAMSHRSPLLFYVLATLAMWTLALGPGGGPGDPPSLVRPYTWLLWLPGFDSLRAPARFAMPGVLCLAVAAGLALARIAPAARPWRAVVGAVAIGGLALDGLMERVPMVRVPPRIVPPTTDAALIELPADDVLVNTAAMYRSTFHGLPVVNGYSGHVPHHYAILTIALSRGDPTPLFHLAGDQALAIVTNDRAEGGRGYGDMVAAIPEVERRGLSSVGSVFLLPARPRAAAVRIEGPILPAEMRDAGDGRLDIDLGESRLVAGLEFPLRDRFAALAPRMLVEASEDGHGWREVWLGWTGGLAFAAALADPRVVPISIPLERVSTRYLRIYPAPSWMRDEVSVRARSAPGRP